MKLRDYQVDAFGKVTEYLCSDSSEYVLCSLPTGWGKSYLVAYIADVAHNCLCIQPSKELLQQNYAKYYEIKDDSKPLAGIYSASFNSKQIRQVTFCTVQSAARNINKFKDFDTVVIDEAHGYSDNNDGQLRRLLKAVGAKKVIGLTATPYKMRGGKPIMLTETQYHPTYQEEVTEVANIQIKKKRLVACYEERFWDKFICVESPTSGAWCKLSYAQTPQFIPDCKIPLKSGDYDQEEVAKYIEQHAFLPAFAEKIQSLHFNKALVFCPNIATAIKLAELLHCDYVSGKTNATERNNIINRFRAGHSRILVNVRVCAVGFDVPDVDCIVLATRIASINLLYQIIGRGVRISPNKEVCQVHDLLGSFVDVPIVENIQVLHNQLFDVGTGEQLSVSIPKPRELIEDVEYLDKERTEPMLSFKSARELIPAVIEQPYSFDVWYAIGTVLIKDLGDGTHLQHKAKAKLSASELELREFVMGNKENYAKFSNWLVFFGALCAEDYEYADRFCSRFVDGNLGELAKQAYIKMLPSKAYKTLFSKTLQFLLYKF